MLNNGCVPSESGPTEVTADFRFTRVMAEQAARARLTLDDDQLSLIARLDALGQQLVSTTGRPQGVYVWGRTGRGKSFILDHFFASLPLAARRRVQLVTRCDLETLVAGVELEDIQRTRSRLQQLPRAV